MAGVCFFLEVRQVDELEHGEDHELLSLGADFLHKLNKDGITVTMSALASRIDFLLVMECREFLRAMNSGNVGVM